MLAGAEVVEEPAELDGWIYTARTYRPPAHLAEAVQMTSFAFAAEQPGDAAINVALAGLIPRGMPGDDLHECMAGALSAHGVSGYVEQLVQPSLVSRRFLGVDEANSNYCGGAHPNHWQVMHTYDRQTGEPIDLFGWLGDERIDGEDSTIADELRTLIFARWPADVDAECREYAADTQYWSIGLAREGLIFEPDLPHVATACEERVTVEWDVLAPFLDAEGKAGLAALRD